MENYLKIFDKIISYNEKNFIKLNLNYFDFINKDIVQINTDGSPNIPNLFSKNGRRFNLSKIKKSRFNRLSL